MEVINWDEYFMGIAALSAKRSKDPSTQVGCCIVLDKRIVAVGYNGLPYGCEDTIYPWAREGDYLETKYPYVVHAEMNAILNSYAHLEGATLYTTLFPCNECCKAIIQSGIKEIIFLSDKHKDIPSTIAAKRILNSAKIPYKKFHSDKKEINIVIESIDFNTYA